MKKYTRPALTKMQLNMESAILSGSAAGGESININREEATSQPLFYRPQITPVAE